MDRRQLLLAGTATLAAGPALAAGSSLRQAARDAFIYTLPMNEVANVRARSLGAGVPAGRLFGQRGLATPEAHNVTTPNNDTVYASAFIDLTNGPATITVPPK